MSMSTWLSWCELPRPGAHSDAIRVTTKLAAHTHVCSLGPAVGAEDEGGGPQPRARADTQLRQQLAQQRGKHVAHKLHGAGTYPTALVGLQFRCYCHASEPSCSSASRTCCTIYNVHPGL